VCRQRLRSSKRRWYSSRSSSPRAYRRFRICSGLSSVRPGGPAKAARREIRAAGELRAPNTHQSAIHQPARSRPSQRTTDRLLASPHALPITTGPLLAGPERRAGRRLGPAFLATGTFSVTGSVSRGGVWPSEPALHRLHELRRHLAPQRFVGSTDLPQKRRTLLRVGYVDCAFLSTHTLNAWRNFVRNSRVDSLASRPWASNSLLAPPM
jgi:hypothetical protein